MLPIIYMHYIIYILITAFALNLLLYIGLGLLDSTSCKAAPTPATPAASTQNFSLVNPTYEE